MKFAAKAIAGIRYFVNFLRKRDERSMYILAEALSRQIYPKYKFSEFGRLIEYDEGFIRYYEQFCGTDNYHSLDRKYTLDQLMKLVTTVAGDTVECGAYKGAASYLICRRIVGLDKTHHVFDSFEGLSMPGPEDGTHWTEGGMAVNEAILMENLRGFDFVVCHKGWIPERFDDVKDKRFCFVHLDVDLYQPTRDALIFFYPRTNPGGIILCDDYGFVTCPGAKTAMDSFFSDKPEEVVLLSTGQGVVIKKSI